MIKFLEGFSQYDLLSGGLDFMSICSCCGASAVGPKATHETRSILIGHNLTEEQMQNMLAKHNPLRDTDDYVNKRVSVPWTYFSVPLEDGTNISLMLQLPKEQ